MLTTRSHVHRVCALTVGVYFHTTISIYMESNDETKQDRSDSYRHINHFGLNTFVGEGMQGENGRDDNVKAHK